MVYRQTEESINTAIWFNWKSYKHNYMVYGQTEKSYENNF